MSESFRFKLTDEQKQIVGTVRELTQGEFRERGLAYMNGAFPWDNIRRLADIGVLGMAVPQAYGGAEFGVFDTALVLEEIAKGCYVTAMAVLGEVGVQTRIIATYAPEAIKRRLLPAVCTGDCILAICMTEPQAGTDVASYTTNTTVRGDTLRLMGVKTLVSRAEEAGAFVVFTRVNGRPGRDGIGCVLVEKGLWRMWHLSGLGWEETPSGLSPSYEVRYAESGEGHHIALHLPLLIEMDTLVDPGTGLCCVRDRRFTGGQPEPRLRHAFTIYDSIRK